jgi:hypothetical protein
MTQVRLPNGQRVTFSTVCEFSIDMARHEIQRIFYVLRDLHVCHTVFGSPWLDDEQASIQFGSTHVFTLMGGSDVDS